MGSWINYRETIWNMIVVSSDECLQEDTLVVFKAPGPEQPPPKPSAGGKATVTGQSVTPVTPVPKATPVPGTASVESNPPAEGIEWWRQDLYLTVIRNAQGHFLPAISSSSEAAIWRLQKSTDTNTEGSVFLEGESIRISWRFDDQTAGFRDFSQDVFGRIRHNPPDDAPAELFFKVPFPGFEDLEKVKDRGRSMILDGDKDSKEILKPLKVRSYNLEKDKKGEFRGDSVTYALYDVSFRLDVLGKFHVPIKVSQSRNRRDMRLHIGMNSEFRQTFAFRLLDVGRRSNSCYGV